jgi:hypothetical protein
VHNAVTMSSHSQVSIPYSFIQLYVEPGRVKASLTMADLMQRYELCEDLALSLTEHARNVVVELRVTEDDVLHRVFRGLRAEASGLQGEEPQWVTTRLAELLGWATPGETAFSRT